MYPGGGETKPTDRMGSLALVHGAKPAASAASALMLVASYAGRAGFLSSGLAQRAACVQRQANTPMNISPVSLLKATWETSTSIIRRSGWGDKRGRFRREGRARQAVRRHLCVTSSSTSSEETKHSPLGSALHFKSIVDGKAMPAEEFEGKPVLIVNTASLCG